jgi:phospholipase C
MTTWWPRIMADYNDPFGVGSFRRYDKFNEHWQSNEAIHDVVFIEPKYTDDPIQTLRQPNDDHCPTGVTGGQKFLADIYHTIIGNEHLWKSTMLIVTYDEHGGFFDHVTPPPVQARAGNASFSTTGVRVPAFVISPYVRPGSVFSDLVDSTSILKLLADRYTPGTDYSPAVSARQKHFKPLSAILDNKPNPTPPPRISHQALEGLVNGHPAVALDIAKASATSQAFQKASEGMAKMHPNVFQPSGKVS